MIGGSLTDAQREYIINSTESGLDLAERFCCSLSLIKRIRTSKKDPDEAAARRPGPISMSRSEERREAERLKRIKMQHERDAITWRL